MCHRNGQVKFEIGHGLWIFNIDKKEEILFSFHYLPSSCIYLFNSNLIYECVNVKFEFGYDSMIFDKVIPFFVVTSLSICKYA
jgi:hypothetical protein